MDLVAALASQVVSVLAPYLPHLLNAGRNILGGAAQDAEANSWDLAKELWGKLRPKIETKAATQEAIRDVARHPNDQDFQVALRVQIRKLLEEDPVLRSDINQLVENAKPGSTANTVITYGSHSPAAGGDQYFGPYFGGDYNASREQRKRH